MLDFLPHKVVLQVTLEPACGWALAANWPAQWPRRKGAARGARQAFFLQAETLSKPEFEAPSFTVTPTHVLSLV